MGMAGSSIPAERIATSCNGSMSPSHFTINVLREKKNDDIAANSIPRILILVFGGEETTGVSGELVDGVSDSITRFRSSTRSAIYIVRAQNKFILWFGFSKLSSTKTIHTNTLLKKSTVLQSSEFHEHFSSRK